jgi:P pilus assembly chaperone PapD
MFKITLILTSRAGPTKRFYRVLLLLLLGVYSQVQASFQIEGTRLIYLGQDKEVSISVMNQAPVGSVLQSWISHEDESNTSDVPFAIVQPLVQLRSHERHLLRILYVGEGLPVDRESMLWLNIMEVPLKPEGSDVVQFAIRQRLKLFYRPSGLQGSASDSIKKLIWKSPDGQRIEVQNPSTFHLSLTDIVVASNRNTKKISEYVILKPGETRLFENPTDGIKPGAKIKFTEITDVGLQTRHSADLQ